MQHAAEDGQSDEPPGRERRLPQFRIRIRDPVDGLRRTRAVVVADVLSDDPVDVIDGEEKEVIQPCSAKTRAPGKARTGRMR